MARLTGAGEGRAFVLPVADRWLVHAPLEGVSALVNRAAVVKLLEQPPDGDGRLAELSSLIAGGAGSAPTPRDGPIEPLFLGLIPTRACNLRCVYCGFGSASGGPQMDLRMAASLIDWMASHARQSGRQTLDIHLFGGEPLAAGDVVEVAVHRARAAAAQHGLTLRLEIATNGACDGQMAGFLGDYFDTVVLSFDGPREVHDRRRPGPGGRGSFEDVARTARILCDSDTELCYRTCVADDNVEKLGETVRWFCDEFPPATIDVETLQPTPESEAAGLAPPDPYRFAIQFWRAGRLAAQYGVTANYAAAVRETPRLSFCPVGNDALIVSPEGRVAACYLPEREWLDQGLDLYLGNFDAGTMTLDPVAVDRVRRLATRKPRCRDCFCQWSCAGGCHVHHAWDGKSRTYDDFCVQTRLITAFSLLEGLGAASMVDRLLDLPAALETLATQASDRLEHWEAAPE
ncbi:MAG: radical SAM protein [Bryobacterales bacterium]|nr:radical SAM protein [Bryobacterales bacterium]